MADTITDNRTAVDNADSATPYDDLAGVASGTLDTDVKYQGTGSIGEQISNTRQGILFDAGSAQNWANNHFYLLINCGIVGLLDTKANSGFTIRFCGATVTDWFEVDVGGSDDWPGTFEGGWAQFVIDIEEAKTNPDTTNGTPPATSAIRYIGWSGITSGAMTKMVDNTWIDEIRRLPDGSAGVIVQGRNGGTSDWTWDDVITELDTVKAGTCRRGPGGSVVINTPIQFFIDDGSTHAFNDTNQVILWDDQEFAATDLYGMTVLGAATGTANFTAGIKTGTGDDATGAQGWIISAAASGVRWFFDADAANIDSMDLYGCQFQHGGDFQLDQSSNEIISCLFVDCDSTVVSNSLFLRNSIVNANTADGVAFATTDDLTDVKFCAFQFSDGHGVELTTPRVATQASKGNTFAGYGADATNDAAIYNNTAGAVTINVTDSGDTPTVRDGTSASTTVNNAVSVQFEAVDKDDAAIQSLRVTSYLVSDDSEVINALTNVSGIASTTFSGTVPADVYYRYRKASPSATKYVNVSGLATIESGTGLAVKRSMKVDSNNSS